MRKGPSARINSLGTAFALPKMTRFPSFASQESGLSRAIMAQSISSVRSHNRNVEGLQIQGQAKYVSPATPQIVSIRYREAGLMISHIMASVSSGGRAMSNFRPNAATRSALAVQPPIRIRLSIRSR